MQEKRETQVAMLVKCVERGVAFRDALKMLGLNRSVYECADVMQRITEAEFQARRIIIASHGSGVKLRLCELH